MTPAPDPLAPAGGPIPAATCLADALIARMTSPARAGETLPPTGDRP